MLFESFWFSLGFGDTFSLAFSGTNTPKGPLSMAYGQLCSSRHSSPHEALRIMGTQVFLPSLQAAQSPASQAQEGTSSRGRGGSDCSTCAQLKDLGAFSVLVCLLP